MKNTMGMIKNGRISMFGFSLQWKIGRSQRPSSNSRAFTSPYNIHLGPGPNWTKPNNQWVNVDIDPTWGDIVVDFKDFKEFPLDDSSTQCIYGSHVFEHMSIWVTDKVFSECYRILTPGGYLRVVLPDAEKSIRQYIAGNAEFPLFRRRRDRAEKNYGLNYTLFDCLREDFLSRSGQRGLLGDRALAHQNAWDYESIENDLRRAGFTDVYRSALRESKSPLFNFEGTYECEALEDDRSLYVEAQKEQG